MLLPVHLSCMTLDSFYFISRDTRHFFLNRVGNLNSCFIQGYRERSGTVSQDYESNPCRLVCIVIHLLQSGLAVIYKLYNALNTQRAVEPCFSTQQPVMEDRLLFFQFYRQETTGVHN